MSFEIEGLSGLQNAIEEKIKQIQQGAERGVSQAVQNLASEIADDAPVDTGELQGSVSSDGDSVRIGADYATFVEDEQPFIQPAISRNRQQIVDDIVEGIRNG